jgi:GntR family transcriptional regulator
MPATTLYGQVAADLRESIASGQLSPGAVIPSETQLVEQYGISRVTIRRALMTLEAEGLISAHQGRGRVVRDRRTMIYRPQQEYEPRISSTMDRFTAALAHEGRQPSQTIEVAVESATPVIAKRLGVPEGAPVVARKRVRSIDGEPTNINDTYHRHDLVKDTAVMDPRDIPEGSNTIVERVIGREVRAIDEFYIRMPTPEEARRLHLGVGTPVAVHYCTGYTADDQVVRVEYFCLPGDRHVILYERIHPTDDDQT